MLPVLELLGIIITVSLWFSRKMKQVLPGVRHPRCAVRARSLLVPTGTEGPRQGRGLAQGPQLVR